ncbi:hypothetical protein BGZ73_004187 [Actinomortierella ambigua]|nr:hypothetical protein BGZ73_004187 [Actinomortierella ambigua]
MQNGDKRSSDLNVIPRNFLARLDKPSDPKKVAQLEQDLARMAMFLNQIHTMACAKTEDGLGSSPSSPSSSHEAVDWASVPSLVSIVDDGSGLPTRPASESRGDHDAAGGHKKKLSQQDEQELIKHRETLLARAQHSKGNFFVVQTGSNIATQE